MKTKKYYVYCGYYEIWISDRRLGRPLVYQGWNKTIGAAIDRAERIDEDTTICFDESVAEDALEFYYGVWEEGVQTVPTFNGEEYEIKNR